MSYATQRDALSRTRQDIVVLGVPRCANWYATQVQDIMVVNNNFPTFWTAVGAGSFTITQGTHIAPDGNLHGNTAALSVVGDYYHSAIMNGGVATSKGFTASIWLRTVSGAGTVTLWINEGTTKGAAEFESVQVNVTETWTRFWVNKLFSGAAAGNAYMMISRETGDLDQIVVWGYDFYRNPNDEDAVIKFPTLINPGNDTMFVSGCAAADAGDGARCYFTKPTCQNPTNYNDGNEWELELPLTGIREYRFCRKDAPLAIRGEQIVPSLVSLAETEMEIDPERAVTVNDRVEYKFEDEGQPGVWDLDKQSEGGLINTASGNGTWWRRFAAIHANFANPEGYLRRRIGFVEAGATEDDFQLRADLIMKNLIVGVGGIADLECGSRLRITRKKIPSSISKTNVLRFAITNSDTELEFIDTGEITAPGDGYTVVLELDPEGVGNGPEKVIVTAKDDLTSIATVQRARWGTTAAAHPAGTAFREIAEFGTERANPVGVPLGKNGVDILLELARMGGIPEARLERATMEALRDLWLPSSIDTVEAIEIGRLLRRTVVEATEVEDLIAEVRVLLTFFMWTNETQNLTGNFYAPPVPTETLVLLTDDESFESASLAVDASDEDRITRVVVAYDLAADAPGDAIGDYDSVQVHIAADEETRGFYGEERTREILSKWLRPGDDQTGIELGARSLGRYSRGARRLTGRVEAKDDDIVVGQFVRVQTDLIQDAHGNAERREMQVYRKKYIPDGKIELGLIDLNLPGKVGFWSGSIPDYDSASEEEQRYGFWTDDEGLVGGAKDHGSVWW